MELWKAKGAIPFYLVVFFTSFVQMGLFILFQRWLSFSFDGPSFFWRSMLLQFSLFVPHIFMMPVASFFAGRFSKGRVMAWSSVGMTAALIAIAVLFGLDIGWVAFGLMLLYGIFLSIFSPAKLGIIKELFGESRLTNANSWQMVFSILGIMSVSFLTIGFTPDEDATIPYLVLPYVFLGVSVISTIFTFFIPRGRYYTKLKMRSPKRNFAATWSMPLVRLSILGLAIFWAISQIFLLLSQDLTGEHLMSLFQKSLILTAIGYIVGSRVAAYASKTFIEVGLVPFAVFGSAIITFTIPFVETHWLQSILYAMLGGFAGFIFVILRTVIQQFTRPDSSGRIHAVSNMIQMSILLLLLGGQSLLLIFTDIEVHQFFFFVAIMLTICFVLTYRLTPMAFLRAVLRFLFAFVFRYRLKTNGVRNIPETGPVLLVGSHYSFIDWAVLQMCCPRPLKIASNWNTSPAWYQRWLRYSSFLIPIHRRDPKPAMEAIHQALLDGEAIVIFPEGEVSKTPHITRFSIDYSEAIKDTEAKIVPFYIQGLWGGPYSHASDAVMLGPASTRIVSVGFAPAIPATTSEEEIRTRLRDLAITTWDNAINHYKTIVPMWLTAMKRRRFRPILIDPAGDHVSGYKMIRLVRNISRRLRKKARNNDKIALLLPSSREGAMAYISILAAGKTTVNLNYTSPADVVVNCVRRTKVNVIVTSKAFYEKLCRKNPAFEPLQNEAELFFFDEMEHSVKFLEFVVTALESIFVPKFILERFWFARAKLSDTATILFSSGSEGTPKGVKLSHKNFIANTQQTDAVVRLRRSDVMLAELPIFHSFGLTATILMPLLDGVPMVLLPDPTDIKTMARACAEHKATILMGTPTFLRAFSVNRWVHPMCLDYLRLVVSGAEKLRQEMRDSFKLKFGKNIFEAYGCTETAPMATMNSPNVLLDDFLTMEKCNEIGTIGLPVPGTRIAIADPETNEFLPIGSEGMVLIGGPQVMQGYFEDEDRTKASIVEKNGHRWYRTGDKGKLSPDGFITLLDRYSRFAKLGGEMISLTAVESRIQDTKLLEGSEFITVAVADSVKGERIVLMFTGEFDPDEIARSLRKSGIPPLMIPGSVFKVDSLPKLGSGKWDFTNLKKLANELTSQPVNK